MRRSVKWLLFDGFSALALTSVATIPGFCIWSATTSSSRSLAAAVSLCPATSLPFSRCPSMLDRMALFQVLPGEFGPAG